MDRPTRFTANPCVYHNWDIDTMSMLSDWQRRHGISDDAMTDLRRALGMVNRDYVRVTPGMSEAAVASRGVLAAAKQGIRLWRNNRGAFQDDTGRWVRYGLCNDSKQMGQLLRSSDRIGIRPHVVTLDDVGKTHGIFTAREWKAQDWHYKGTAHEIGQLNFINLVNALGGDAKFSNGV